MSRAEIHRLFREFDINQYEHPNFLESGAPQYADAFWKLLGAVEAETMDVSDYEGATIVHDLNLPVPDRLKLRYDAVCDLGTLEHVFDFPTALENCLSMVRVGGHFLTFSVANNCFGHGFYQFSPELFHRVFSPANGFAIDQMVAVEYGPRRRWYDVADPACTGRRVLLINRFPCLLFVQARKVRETALFAPPPHQSDYVSTWARCTPNSTPPRPPPATRSAISLPALKRRMLNWFPGGCRALESLYNSLLNRTFSFRNRSSFKPRNKR